MSSARGRGKGLLVNDADRAELKRLMRHTREQAWRLLDGLEETMAEDIAAAAPGRERAYVRRLCAETRVIAESLRQELKVTNISEARGRKRKT